MTRRIPTIAVCTAAILTLAACAGQSTHKLAELDKIDAMSCAELAAYKAELTGKVPEAEAMELVKATAAGGLMLAAMLAAGPLAALAAPAVSKLDTDLGARANGDLVEVRRAEVHRCNSGTMKASASK